MTRCRAGRSLRRSLRTVPAVPRATWARSMSSVTVGRAPWVSWWLRAAARALTPGAGDEEFHEVRKLAKRARYVAETVAPALEPDDERCAARFARKARRVQDVLGEHQDAAVAVQE